MTRLTAAPSALSLRVARSRSLTLPVALAVLATSAAWALPAGSTQPAEASTAAAAPARSDALQPLLTLVQNPDLQPLRRGDARPAGRSPGDFRSAVQVSLNGDVNHMSVASVTVLPGSTLTLELPAEARVEYSAGRAVQRSTTVAVWTAPDSPGFQAMAIRDASGGEVRINVLVAHPATEIVSGALSGYRIGSYRREPLRGDPAYLPPTGFVAVRPSDHDILVAPHFTIGQFLCKQPGDPKMVVLSTPLILKLELVLEAVNDAGIPARGLTVMSGYRTPWYNRSIGNTTDYSRHLWGDAADIYVDENGDGDMDDLNGDGVRNVADARFLARIVDGLAAEGGEEYPAGGMSTYRRNSAHGPFVHVDARGYRARW